MSRSICIALALAVLSLGNACGDQDPEYSDAFVPPPDSGGGSDGGDPPPDDGATGEDAAMVPPGVERRCFALGDACVCSEPLDTNGWAIEGERWANPVDSEGESQCRGRFDDAPGAVWFPKVAVKTRRTRLFPGGPLGFVWENQLGATIDEHGQSYLAGTRPNRSGSKRLCMRVYTEVDPSYTGAGDGDCTTNAQMRLAFARAPADGGPGPRSALRLVEQGGSFQLVATRFGGMERRTIAAGGDPVSLDDCRSGWCRLELCVGGNLDEGAGISVDGSIAVVGSGSVATFGPTTLGDALRGPIRLVHIADMTREGTCAGTRRYSHAMQAEWPDDSGQHIGPAVEVEGG